jgi:hypothetical protein
MRPPAPARVRNTTVCEKMPRAAASPWRGSVRSVSLKRSQPRGGRRGEEQNATSSERSWSTPEHTNPVRVKNQVPARSSKLNSGRSDPDAFPHSQRRGLANRSERSRISRSSVPAYRWHILCAAGSDPCRSGTLPFSLRLRSQAGSGGVAGLGESGTAFGLLLRTR